MDGFGKRLRTLRRERGITIDQISSKVGMTGDAILKLESGVRGKTLEKLPSLAKALGCSIDDLFPEMDAPEEANVSEGKTVCADGFDDETMEGWSE